MPGQVVTFSERGPSAGGTIGVAHGARGTLRFTPAAGRAERREIVAGVEQDGALRARLVVGHYRSAAAHEPGKVRDLHARRAGRNLVATWDAAGTVQVSATLPDGRRVVTRSRGRKATFNGATRGTISIRALSADGLAGAMTSVTVRWRERPAAARARRSRSPGPRRSLAAPWRLGRRNCEQSVCPAVKSRRAALAAGPLFAT